MNDRIMDIMNQEELYLNENQKKGTDKFTKHPYSEEFNVLFEKFIDKKIRLLEIGAYYGASTIIWDKYFPLGDITVLDIEPRTALDNIVGRVDPNRTRIIINDAYDQEFVKKLGTFDIINDDGPHDLVSQLVCLDIYYPLLNEGGYLIIEDIPDAQWLDLMKDKVPEGKFKTIDYHAQNRGASDSRLFICWK